MKELRETKEASKIALKLMNELIATEYKINKKTPRHIAHKYNLPLLYVYDVCIPLTQYEDNELDELKKSYKNIQIKDDMTALKLSIIRELALDELEFGTNINGSSGEIKIKEYLDNNKITYFKEKTFDDLIYIGNLKFDFYLPKQKIAIEFDGIQHYKPIGYFGGNDSFIETQKRDKLKDIYCKEKNIKLIRIPYFEIDNINTILDELFNGN